MNKKITKILLMGVVLIMGLGLFAGCSKSEGVFYSLEEAYEQGWLTQEDLKSIAYYFNGSTEGNEEIMSEGFVPVPKNPETLSNEIEKKIRSTHLSEIKKDYPFATLKRIWVEAYYGIYGDSVVAVTRDDIRVIDILFLPEHTIGEVLFFDYNPIYVWRAK